MKIYHQNDIIGAMLNEVRAQLGSDVLSPEVEQSIEMRLRIHWGGQEVYVRKTNGDTDERALAIRTRYNMCNRRELQAEYGLGRAQFYKILKGG